MLRRPSNYRDRLDIGIPSDTFCSHKIPDSFYGIHGLQLHLPHKTESFFEGQEDKVDFVLRTFSGSRASFSRRSCQRAKIPWRTVARKNLKRWTKGLRNGC